MTEMTTTLAPMDVAGRLPRLRAALAAQGVPALLVTSRANVRYLTGFTGSAGSLLVSADDAMLVTDGRYRTQSAEQIAAAGVDARVEIGLTMAEQREMFARAAAAFAQVGLEEYSITWAEQRDFAAAFAGVDVVPAGTPVEDLRRVKDAGEVDRIRAACAIASDAFESLLSRFGDGVTEREFAPLDQDARTGREWNSFDPIIVGPNGETAAPPTSACRTQRVDRLRLRLRRRQLLLGHDPHRFGR